MVYLGSIIKEQMEMKADEIICLIFKSGRKAYIKKTYTLQRMNGDLKITGTNGLRCYIDTAEIEQVFIGKEKALKGDD